MPKRLRLALLALHVACCCPLAAGTLQEQLDLAVAAFRSGDYGLAHWRFEALELDFGTAPEFRERGLQKRTLPLRAYAALQADRPTEALAFFHTVLAHHDPDHSLQAFCFFNAALAQEQCGAEARAAATFRQYRMAFPGTPEAGLALLREAELKHRLDASDEAGALLDAFYASEAPPVLRLQGRLRALQFAVELEQAERSRELLFETPWQADDMPEIAALSFAALEVGDLLLEEGRYDDAIRAYRHVLPMEVLVAKQARRIARERSRAHPHRGRGATMRHHVARLLGRLEAQLQTLRTMADYTPGLYLRLGQAFMLADRHREAVLLFRTIATGEAFETEIRAQAHYRWVVALCQSGQWEPARATAHGFLAAYPEHTLTADALFLVAHAFQGEGRYGDAIEVLDGLIGNQPESPGAPRWYFTRGYNHCFLESYAAARESFAAVPEHHGRSPLVLRCRLWHGLTRFFEKDYDASLDELEAVRADAGGHPQEPEAIYRIANVHYARRNYAGTLIETGTLLEQFPGHHRAAEAQALRGDALMGLGELVEAAAAFRMVPPQDARLFDYATFQTARIYRALERPDLLEAHLRAYIERDDAAERPRVSEALFWLGRSMREDGRIGEAFPLFEATLERFGDAPEARAVDLILTAYADLWKHRRHGDPGEWIRREQEKALQNDRLTWYARLTCFAAGAHRAQQETASPDVTLLSIHRLVPVARQDAASLAAVGLALAERGYASADDYFEALLTRFPERPEIAAALYGKARLAADGDQPEEALRWLNRFLEETPTGPPAADARLLAADILRRQGRFEAARTALNRILEIKSLRGRPHARALAAMATLEKETGEPRRAIACWQRVYTLYRAYPELLAEAYWESALLFESIGDVRAAHNTLDEMLADQRLRAFAQYAPARARLPELAARIPPSAVAAQPAPYPPRP